MDLNEYFARREIKGRTLYWGVVSITFSRQGGKALTGQIESASVRTNVLR